MVHVHWQILLHERLKAESKPVPDQSEITGAQSMRLRTRHYKIHIRKCITRDKKSNEIDTC